MIKNKRARRPARQLRFIKLRWLRRLYLFIPSTQRLLSIKHMRDTTKESIAGVMTQAILEVTLHKKKINRLVRQIKKCKLK
jgi:hypothetical protein